MRRALTLAAVAPSAPSRSPRPPPSGPGWAKVSGDDVSGIDQASLVVNNGRVVAAWPSGTGSDLASSIAFRGWAPTPAASLAGASAIATAAGGYDNTSRRGRPWWRRPTGLRVVTGAALAGTGQSRTYLTSPLTEGAPGGPTTEIAAQLTGAMDALTVADGGLIVASMTNGEMERLPRHRAGRRHGAADPAPRRPRRVPPGARAGRLRPGVAGLVLERLRQRRHLPDPDRPRHRGPAGGRAADQGAAERVARQQRLPPGAGVRRHLPDRLRRPVGAGGAPAAGVVGARRGRAHQHRRRRGASASGSR